MAKNHSSWASAIEVSMAESAWTAGDLDSDLVLHSFCFLPSVMVLSFRYLYLFSLINEIVFSAFCLCLYKSFRGSVVLKASLSCS